MASLSLTDFVAGNEITAAGHNSNNSTLETWSTALSDDNFSSAAGMYTAYRTIQTVKAGVNPSALAAADYLFTHTAASVQETTDTGNGIDVFYLDDADWTVSGRTLKLRVRAQAYTNATAPAMTITAGLFPVSSVTGGVGANQATLGAVTSGSTVAFASPSASTTNQGNSGDFSFPADGHYALGFSASGAGAANSRVVLAIQLQLRWT